jgi:tRNA 2-thiouridine synthesizing protein A
MKNMDRSIDCVGAMCPLPVVKAQIQYRKLNVGESMTIISDHSCTSQNLKDAFRKYKCIITEEEEAGIWYINIKKIV